MKYLIDSNTFVAPHRGYAPIDVAISLWSKIKDMADEGIICSIDMVRGDNKRAMIRFFLFQKVNYRPIPV